MDKTVLKEDDELPSFDELYASGNPLSFRIVFVDFQKVVCDALKSIFPENALSAEVRVFGGKFEEYLESEHIDCIVSSSNAFGLMNHGFDRSLCQVLATNGHDHELKSKIQQTIIDRYHGEQPVGTCSIIETGHPTIKYVAYAPTRRTNYSVKGTDNIYMATKAICGEIRRWNEKHDEEEQIKNVLSTGLGTFYGAVPPEESARQTVLGWLLARMPKPKMGEIDWMYANARQEFVGYGGFDHFMKYMHKNSNSLTQKQQKMLVKSVSMNTKKHRGDDCLLM